MNEFTAVANAIFDAAVLSLGDSAKFVARDARRRAPVRHLYAGTGYRFRYKSIGEIKADREIRARLGLGPEKIRGKFRPKVAYGKKPPVRWPLRTPPKADELLAHYDNEMLNRWYGQVPQKTMLDRRGAYEVRTKRAMWKTWGRKHIGGRLRQEISATAPTVSGKRAEAWVISPTPYAKYMEFGTRHNAAHPFLRPALKYSRKEIVSRIAAAVAEASRTGATETVIDVMVRI